MIQLAHLSDRAVLRLSGADVRDFLQGQITSDIAALTPAAPLYAGHLSPQGKTLFALILFADGDDVLVDAAAHQAEALGKRLAMFKLRRAAVIVAEPALAVWARWPDPPLQGEVARSDGGMSPAPTLDPRLPALGRRWLAPADAHRATASLADYHAHRLALGVPDADELTDLLWLETNAEALRGVSFAKGCYVGQENTARMHHRDKVRRRLATVRVSADAPADAPVTATTEHGPREAGTLRGTGHGGLRMAHLRVEHEAAPLSVGGVAVELVG